MTHGWPIVLSESSEGSALRNCILVVALCLAGCASTVTEIRGGRPWTIETRSIGPIVLTRSEYPQPSTADLNRQRIADLVPRGGWIITAGAILAMLGLLGGLYVTAPALHHIASVVMVIGGALMAAGIWLIGVGMLGAYGIICACVCMAVASVYYFRNHQYKRDVQ